MIKKAQTDWPYPEMEREYHAKSGIWIEVTESFYDQALNVLPPIYVANGFMVSEPLCHEKNIGVYSFFIRVGNGGFARYFARYLTSKNVKEEVEKLHKFLFKNVVIPGREKGA